MKGDRAKIKEKEDQLLVQKKEHRLIQVSVENVQQQYHNKQDELQSLNERLDYIEKCIALAKSQKLAQQTTKTKKNKQEDNPSESTSNDPKQVGFQITRHSKSMRFLKEEQRNIF